MRPRLPLLAVAMLMLFAGRVSTTVFYVDLNNANPTPPYTNWLTAATNIQDAVDAANVGDQVLVTNGIYQSGGRLVSGDITTNRLVVTNAVTVQSVNGAAATVIKGYQMPGTTNGNNAVRCVYLATNAVLIGFTLTNGATQSSSPSNRGGGVLAQSLGAYISNCVIVGNSAVYGAGAFSGTLNNCVLSNNVAQNTGGGAYATYSEGSPSNSALNNCLMVGNSASYGGAVGVGGLCSVFLNNCTISGNSASVFGGGGACVAAGSVSWLVASNCIIFGNTAPTFPNYEPASAPEMNLNYCCTAPLPTGGTGNFTNTPLFVNQSAGDFHLQSNSPCINAGNNSCVSGATDLDGNPRIKGSTVDIGAYEFQNPASTISYAWLQQHGLPTDGTADYTDTDYDGMNNWQEWICGTDPIDPSSVLRMLPPSNSVSGITVNWQSVNGKTYYLQRGTNLQQRPAFFSIQSNIVGQAATTSFTDTNATGARSYFYRVGIQQ